MQYAKRSLCLFLAVWLVFAVLPQLTLPVRAEEYSGECGSLTWHYNINTGFMTIEGSGEMKDFSASDRPAWYSYRRGVKTLVIADGITSIGDDAFVDFSALEHVTIPDSVTRIGKYAFEGCTWLADLTIPAGVTVINDSTCSGCGFRSIEIPDSVTSIERYAFASCVLLEHASLPKGLTQLSEGIFSACQSLKSITIPESVTSIGNYAFCQCSMLDDVTIPKTVQTIGSAAFSECTCLIRVTIPESVQRIAYLAFSDCSNLLRVTVMNKDCEINADVSTLGDPKRTEIIGRKGSTAEDYANQFGYKFTDYDDAYGGPDAPVNPFVDLERDEYYYAPVLWAVNHDPQITKGTNASHFSPDATCTRGQIVTFLWRANGCPEPVGTANPFSDVHPSDYYYKAVLWAVEQNITNGTGNGVFSPNAGCTRGQVVTFLWRTEHQPAPWSMSNPFMDVRGGYYYTAVIWAVEKNITNGTGPDTFSPEKTCTRAEIVTFLHREFH